MLKPVIPDYELTALIDGEDSPGSIRDVDIARQYGVAPCTVHYQRKRLGLPSANQRREAAMQAMIAHERRPGFLTDPVLAQKLGIREWSARQMRRRLGIPNSFERRQAASEGGG